MNVVKFVEAPFYTLPGHEQVTARRLQGAGASAADFVLVGHSSFPDKSAVPMDVAPIGKVYIVTEGALTIEQADGARHILRTYDSVFVPPGEARAVLNESGAPAAMIVIPPQL
jgi:quercetin dioxygenase-like cupin family protein